MRNEELHKIIAAVFEIKSHTSIICDVATYDVYICLLAIQTLSGQQMVHVPFKNRPARNKSLEATYRG